MGIFQRFASAVGWGKRKDTPFNVQKGTQQSVDMKSYMMQILQTYEAPEGDLELYKAMATNVPILTGAINAYTRMINSGYDVICENDNTRVLTWDIIERLDLEGALNRIIRQMETYGFCGAEIVLNDAKTDIVKIKVIDSRTLRVQKDQWGNIIAYKQIIGIASQDTSGMAPGVVDLDPSTIMYFSRNPDGDSAYGTSLLRSVPFVVSTMLQIEDSIGKIYKRYGAPKYHVSYNPANNIPDDQMTKRMDLIRDEFGHIQSDSDFFSNGDITVSVLTPGAGAISFTEELQHIVEQLLSGLGLPAALLGYNYGSTETHTKEQGMLLVSNLKNSQSIVRRVLENSLFTLIAQVYDLSEIPQFEWDEIQIRDDYQDAQTDEIKIRNAITKRDNGLIDQNTAAQELGYRNAADPNYKSSMKLGRYASSTQATNNPDDGGDK